MIVCRATSKLTPHGPDRMTGQAAQGPRQIAFNDMPRGRIANPEPANAAPVFRRPRSITTRPTTDRGLPTVAHQRLNCLYPADVRYVAHESLAPELAVVANQLCAQGNTLVFWDGYRPDDVQVRMFQ
jgi:D-alanyl-D-alanine dipeptidase